jgi:hypothetical protein
MRVYVATSFATRERVHAFMARLRRRVPDAALAYDWTGHGLSDDPAEIARAEGRAILGADQVVALLPGGPGTWSEVGMALAACGPLDDEPILVGSVLDAFAWRECPIAHLCWCVDTEDEAIELLARRARG